MRRPIDATLSGESPSRDGVKNSERRKYMATITLVDDDENIVASVSLALESHGHTVTACHDGVAGLESLTANPPDLAILDVKMPRMDGMELLRRLRQTSNMPVIMLTSKDEEIDEILGFNLGADDYIHKPFSQRLLLERVKAVLRRADVVEDDAAPGAPPAEPGAKAMRRGKLTLDPERHDSLWDGKPVRLTVTEFLLLQSLAQRPRFCEESRQSDGRRLRRSGLRRRPDHRQPHQADAQEVPPGGFQLRRDRDPVWRRIPLPRVLNPKRLPGVAGGRRGPDSGG